jgi:hypothetical protein
LFGFGCLPKSRFASCSLINMLKKFDFNFIE